jgi:hypothetical protein
MYEECTEFIKLNQQINNIKLQEHVNFRLLEAHTLNQLGTIYNIQGNFK